MLVKGLFSKIPNSASGCAGQSGQREQVLLASGLHNSFNRWEWEV